MGVTVGSDGKGGTVVQSYVVTRPLTLGDVEDFVTRARTHGGEHWTIVQTSIEHPHLQLTAERYKT
jgi:hypothetical protein